MVIPEAVSFGLHRVEPRVVVRELVEVGPCDLPGYGRIISSDVGAIIFSSVFHLDFQATPEPLKIESVIPEVESDVVGNGQSLDGRECCFLTHS